MTPALRIAAINASVPADTSSVSPETLFWMIFHRPASPNSFFVGIPSIQIGEEQAIGKSLTSDLALVLTHSQEPSVFPVLHQGYTKIRGNGVIGYLNLQLEQPVLYLLGNPKFGARLIRGGQLLNLPITPKGLSGVLSKTDQVMVGLKPFITQVNWQERLKTDPIVNLPSSGYISPVLVIDGKVPSRLFQWYRNWKNSRSATQLAAVDITLIEGRSPFVLKRRRVALAMAILFLMLLAGSVFMGNRRRIEIEHQKQRQQLVDDVTYRLKQAQSLKGLNPMRAKTLLAEAKKTLENYSQDQVLGSDLETLKQAVTSAYGVVASHYEVDNPEVFFDLALIKEGFNPEIMSLSEKDLVLLDESSQTLVNLNIKTKAGEIIAGQEVILPNSQVGSIPAWVFLSSGNKIQILDKQTKDQLNSFKLSKISVDMLIGYSNNAYVLDKSAGQLWRFRGTQTGLVKPDGFFEEEEDLTQVLDVAIDGAVWFLYSDGGMAKYTSGIRDAYYPSIPLDVPLLKPDGLFTSEYEQSLYILDKANDRVIAVSKEGQYQGEYLWAKMDTIEGFVVSEELGKLLLLQEGKIYGVDLK